MSKKMYPYCALEVPWDQQRTTASVFRLLSHSQTLLSIYPREGDALTDIGVASSAVDQWGVETVDVVVLS